MQIKYTLSCAGTEGLPGSRGCGARHRVHRYQLLGHRSSVSQPSRQHQHACDYSFIARPCIYANGTSQSEAACLLLPRFEAGGFKFEGTPLEHQVLPEEWLRDWTRNLTTILLEVTDRMFGVLSSSHCHACILTHGEDAPALLHDQEV